MSMPISSGRGRGLLTAIPLGYVVIRTGCSMLGEYEAL
jgi:hypothetical protein